MSEKVERMYDANKTMSLGKEKYIQRINEMTNGMSRYVKFFRKLTTKEVRQLYYMLEEVKYKTIEEYKKRENI